MSDIKQKAIALLNEVKAEQGYNNLPTSINRHFLIDEALCRAIEQREATKQEYSDFRQEVSDVVKAFNKRWAILPQEDWEALLGFIIPAPKPDPLVEVLVESHIEFGPDWGWEEQAEALRAALDARGFEIKEKGQ
jgi:hypothetical protein